MDWAGLLWVIAVAVFAFALWAGFSASNEAFYVAVSSFAPIALSLICLMLLLILKKMETTEHILYFSVALTLWFLGEIFFWLASFMPGIESTYAELFWLTGYVPLAIGLWSISKMASARRSIFQALSLLIVLIAYVVITVDIALPLRDDLGFMANVVHPLASILLFALAVYIITGDGEERCVTAIAGAMLLFAVFDVMYLMALKEGVYDAVARFIDPVYNLAYLMFAYAIYSQITKIACTGRSKKSKK
ncbi:MAG: hypothetical protein N3H30_00590 [Candidatus Micrarchaeota archaeon]|nr:hypothetical protein [Candidatus Micrarchaeota archaeon]